jgi:hypothetical protein
MRTYKREDLDSYQKEINSYSIPIEHSLVIKRIYEISKRQSDLGQILDRNLGFTGSQMLDKAFWEKYWENVSETYGYSKDRMDSLDPYASIILELKTLKKQRENLVKVRANVEQSMKISGKSELNQKVETYEGRLVPNNEILFCDPEILRSVRLRHLVVHVTCKNLNTHWVYDKFPKPELLNSPEEYDDCIFLEKERKEESKIKLLNIQEEISKFKLKEYKRHIQEVMTELYHRIITDPRLMNLGISNGGFLYGGMFFRIMVNMSEVSTIIQEQMDEVSPEISLFKTVKIGREFNV